MDAMPQLRRALGAALVPFEPLELTPAGCWLVEVMAPRSDALLAAIAAAGGKVLR